ncbi:MAG: ABC transporter ATP-binding protein [Anaerolineales bacterium]|nr:MAG: ABC transporter ATP-binding protein [Anaerolineales bacterium]
MASPFQDLSFIVTKRRILGLWRLLRGYRLLYLIASLCLGLGTLARTSTFLWLREFIDNVLPNDPTPQRLLLFGLGFVGLAAIQGLFTFISGALSARTAENVARNLRSFFFDHIQHLSFAYHDQTDTGDLISRASSDIDAVRQFFSDQMVNAGQILLLFIVNFIAIAFIDRGLAIRSVVIVPIVLLTSVWFFRRMSTVYEANQQQESVLSTTLQENLSGVRVVKAFARQAFERQKFERENWEKFIRGRRLITMHAFFWPTTDILAGVQLVGGLYIAARMTMAGSITTGSYLAYAGLIAWIIWPMRNLGRLIVQMSMGLVSFGRVLEIIGHPREPIEQGLYPVEQELDGELIFEKVGFAYADGAKVLEDISFTVAPGEVVALLGSTGSGKSTLVNLIPRFYPYTSGSLRLDGIELNLFAPEYLRKQIGIVEQEPFLFSRTMRENITLGVDRQVDDAEIESAARAAAIYDTILSFPDGLDTLVGEKGVTLSGGQKQRVAIARTLLKDPCLLILDDSTSSVDTLTEVEIREALEGLMQGRTTIIIAHRIQSVMNADKIIVLDHGKITQIGTHDQLILQEGIYQRIYEMQTRIEDALSQELANV